MTVSLTENGKPTCSVPDPSVGRALTASDVALRPGMERAPNPVKLADPCALANSGPDDGPTLSDEELRKAREDDLSWRASDGTRYEAMLVLPDGTAYGQRGPSPTATKPDESNGFGSSLGSLPSEEAITRGIEELQMLEVEGSGRASESSGTASDVAADSENPFANEDNLARGIIGGELEADRRTRVTSTSLLQSVPYRWTGALNQTSNPGYTGCTGVMIGPRHALTAAHCVLREDGSWIPSGWFHPGQTRTSHPNTSGTAVYWDGCHARDWRGGPSERRWDYAILYLSNRQDVANLGWYGVYWWTQASDYNGKWANIHGYPKRTATEDEERCYASPYADDNCGGDMYGHAWNLDLNAFRGDEQLEFNIDETRDQSGSTVRAYTSSAYVSLGVLWGCGSFGGCSGTDRNRAARFRQSMWNDVCSWIAEVSSSYGEHPVCH